MPSIDSSDSLEVPEGIQQGTLRIEPYALTPAEAGLAAGLRPGDVVEVSGERLRIVSGKRDETGAYIFRVVRAQDIFAGRLDDEPTFLLTPPSSSLPI